MNRGKKAIRVITAVLALAPTLSGALGLLGIFNPIYRHSISEQEVLLDSNLRFLNALSLGLGFGLYYILPTLEKHAQVFHLICWTIFIGGLSRLLSIYSLGFPPFPFPLFIPIEILAPPILIYWLSKLKSDTTN